MSPVQFGFAGKPYPFLQKVVDAADLDKSDATPVGVAVVPNPTVPVSYAAASLSRAFPNYQVVTNNEFLQAQQAGRLVYTA